MKTLVIVLTCLMIASCTTPPLDEAKSRQLVEEHIQEASNQNYDRVLELYDPAFLASEPAAVKVEKLQKLNQVLGPVEKFEFVKSTDVKEMGVPRQLKLEYSVKHVYVNTTETFVVLEAEGGYKIAGYYVEEK